MSDFAVADVGRCHLVNVGGGDGQGLPVTVEYNEYDARMPIVRDYYPYEVVIRRDVGDYKKFFQAIKK